MRARPPESFSARRRQALTPASRRTQPNVPWYPPRIRWSVWPSCIWQQKRMCCGQAPSSKRSDFYCSNGRPFTDNRSRTSSGHKLRRGCMSWLGAWPRIGLAITRCSIHLLCLGHEGRFLRGKSGDRDQRSGAGTPARERVLDDTEIRAIWNACQQNDFGRIVRLLILTGCRREEIGQLRWSEINMDTGVMTIPGTRTKNKRELQLPLSPAAIDILRSAKPAEGRAYVFGRSGTDSGFAGWAWTSSPSTVALQARGKASEPYVLHDLRRTMRTGLGKLGIPPHIAELTINHAKGGIVAVYDRYSYQPQMKAALATWADHVTGLVEGRDQNVIPLQRA